MIAASPRRTQRSGKVILSDSVPGWIQYVILRGAQPRPFVFIRWRRSICLEPRFYGSSRTRSQRHPERSEGSLSRKGSSAAPPGRRSLVAVLRGMTESIICTIRYFSDYFRANNSLTTVRLWPAGSPGKRGVRQKTRSVRVSSCSCRSTASVSFRTCDPASPRAQRAAGRHVRMTPGFWRSRSQGTCH